MADQDDQREEAPGGLLGLLLWPIQAAIAAGLGIFTALINGILGAFLPRRPAPDEDQSERSP